MPSAIAFLSMMEKVGDFDPLDPSRPLLSEQERSQLHQQRQQTEREAGYQQLRELCNLGEYDAAKQLAQKNSRWGYDIREGMVVTNL